MMLGLKKVRRPPGRCVAADAPDLQPVRAEGGGGSGVVRGDEPSRAALPSSACSAACLRRQRAGTAPACRGDAGRGPCHPPAMPAAAGVMPPAMPAGSSRRRVGLTCMAVARGCRLHGQRRTWAFHTGGNLAYKIGGPHLGYDPGEFLSPVSTGFGIDQNPDPLVADAGSAAPGHSVQTAVQVRATRCVLWTHSAPQPGSRRLAELMPPDPA